jgi:hypothetical protein
MALVDDLDGERTKPLRRINVIPSSWQSDIGAKKIGAFRSRKRN